MNKLEFFIGAHYNLNNGDRALLEATIQVIQEYCPGANITVSAYRPELLNDERCHVVPWALKNGIREAVLLKLSRFDWCRRMFNKKYKLICNTAYIKALEKADVVLMSGGHHLTDILGTESYYKLASNFIPPMVMNKRYVLLPQSIGPAKEVKVTNSIKKVINKACSVAYRDEASLNFLNSLDIHTKKQYVPDLVYTIDTSKFENQYKRPTVGVALYHSYNSEKRQQILPFVLSNLTSVIDELISKEYDVKIIPMDIGDDIIANQIFAGLKTENKHEHFAIGKICNNILELIEQFKGLSFCLAYKTHSTIFSMICNTPLIAIAYHPKTIEFMEDIGLREYAIKDEDASYDNIMILLKKLEQNSDYIRATESSGVQKQKEKIKDFIKETLTNDID